MQFARIVADRLHIIGSDRCAHGWGITTRQKFRFRTIGRPLKMATKPTGPMVRQAARTRENVERKIKPPGDGQAVWQFVARIKRPPL